MVNTIFGPQTPVRLPLLAAPDGTTGIDVNQDGQIEHSDAYLQLETGHGPGLFDFADLQKAMAQAPEGKPVAKEEVLADLGRQYKDDSLRDFTLVQGALCFDMLSSYRQTQTFERVGDKIFYTLTPDPDAPYEQVGGQDKLYQTGETKLIRDQDGILHWEFGEPAPAPPPPENAVTEATCVRRDGMLHWVFPGEVLEPGDTVVDMSKFQ